MKLLLLRIVIFLKHCSTLFSKLNHGILCIKNLKFEIFYKDRDIFSMFSKPHFSCISIYLVWFYFWNQVSVKHRVNVLAYPSGVFCTTEMPYCVRVKTQDVFLTSFVCYGCQKTSQKHLVFTESKNTRYLFDIFLRYECLKDVSKISCVYWELKHKMSFWRLLYVMNV